MNSTRDVIVHKALNLFSKKGYDGVSMRDIAAAVGIKAASLYNHFKSKEDIFDGIMEQMSLNYEMTANKIQIPHHNMENAVEVYSQISQEALTEVASKLFLYFLKDDFASKFRRMLTIEQYRSSKALKMFKKYFIEDVLFYQSTLFKCLIQADNFNKLDSHIMALHFYAPIFMLLLQYDNQVEKESEALDILAKHVEQFSLLYIK